MANRSLRHGPSGITDYFDDGSLVFFNVGSAEDLARKIEFVFAHPDEVAEIVCKGQQVYREHCWQRERERLIGLVAGLLGGKGTQTAFDPIYAGTVSQRDGSAS